MTRFRHRRLLSLLRIVTLALFALAMVVQPVMAAAGEMHEFSHDASGLHSHAHVLHAGDIGIDDIDAGADAPVLHVLLHFAHCCGTTTAMVPSVDSFPVEPVINHVLSVEVPDPPQARLTPPFKPPRLG